MLILSISHHLYLTRDERYSLIEGKTVNIVGVSVPVWIKDQGISTEPAVEVFCNYELTNSKRAPISFKKDGYRINVPQLSETDKARPKLSNEEWRKMTEEEREKYYKDNPAPLCADWLRDIKDGGGMHLHFREHNKIFQDKDFLEVYHYIHIDDISKLEESVC